ncbi:C-type lectin domain family 4 member K-like [Crassostrea angulata]|uniref:C-type lectin domain family 4 member K-like n=1 Tax=Magallana angulata TaxID=2784310 RepID=UPI0022B1CDC5|nr:C-type lectin domain family 4 member K-like [Crassostrea angulata]
MRSFEFSIYCAFLVLALCSSVSYAATYKEDNALMKNISDLPFQLFSSIQKKTKMIKTAVFETQCSETCCTFNGCESSGSETCDGQMLTNLNRIQSSINDVWRRKPKTIGWYMNIFYHIFMVVFHFFSKQIFCRDQGTTLLQINDDDENKWFTKNFPNVPYWIDFTDNGTEGKWITLSTGKTAYSSWDKGQPANWGKAQHCAFTNYQSRLGRWDDVQCDA